MHGAKERCARTKLGPPRAGKRTLRNTSPADRPRLSGNKNKAKQEKRAQKLLRNCRAVLNVSWSAEESTEQCFAGGLFFTRPQ